MLQLSSISLSVKYKLTSNIKRINRLSLQSRCKSGTKRTAQRTFCRIRQVGSSVIVLRDRCSLKCPKYPFSRQGGTIPIRWHVVPVMMEGESEEHNRKGGTAEGRKPKKHSHSLYDRKVGFCDKFDPTDSIYVIVWLSNRGGDQK